MDRRTKLILKLCALAAITIGVLAAAYWPVEPVTVTFTVPAGVSAAEAAADANRFSLIAHSIFIVVVVGVPVWLAWLTIRRYNKSG
jgi:hypothetical protein